MAAAEFGRRFLETTRGRIVGLLRRGTRTVEELARALGLTDNAVRNHLATLERDGLVRPEGVRRSPGAGKPAVLYELRPEAEPLLSRAYAPVLSTMLEVLVAELPPDRAAELLREVGRRLAASTGGRASGELDDRVRAAAAVLTSLGGEVDVVGEDGTLRLRGWACPLSVAVARRPELCQAVETLVTEIAGAPARECCEHGARPRCCFSIDPAA
jgi:predicted ArsR family transcriptional regulator